MLAITGIVAVVAFIVFLEVPALRKKRQIRELWIFSLLLIMGTGISIALSLHIAIPNPIDWINYIYSPVGRFIENALRVSR